MLQTIQESHQPFSMLARILVTYFQKAFILSNTFSPMTVEIKRNAHLQSLFPVSNFRNSECPEPKIRSCNMFLIDIMINYNVLLNMDKRLWSVIPLIVPHTPILFCLLQILLTVSFTSPSPTAIYVQSWHVLLFSQRYSVVVFWCRRAAGGSVTLPYTKPCSVAFCNPHSRQ